MVAQLIFAILIFSSNRTGQTRLTPVLAAGGRLHTMRDARIQVEPAGGAHRSSRAGTDTRLVQAG